MVADNILNIVVRLFAFWNTLYLKQFPPKTCFFSTLRT